MVTGGNARYLALPVRRILWAYGLPVHRAALMGAFAFEVEVPYEILSDIYAEV
jgi:hypothetical protein